MFGFDEIRLARPEDEARLFDFLMLLHAENAMFPVAPDLVLTMIRHATDRKGGVIGIIDGPDGRIEGSFGAVVEHWWYTYHPSLNERWNFVREDCRRSTHAKHLIEWAKHAARSLGIPLFMGVLSTERTEAKLRLYRRQLKPMGGYFADGLGVPAFEKTERAA